MRSGAANFSRKPEKLLKPVGWLDLCRGWSAAEQHVIATPDLLDRQLIPASVIQGQVADNHYLSLNLGQAAAEVVQSKAHRD